MRTLESIIPATSLTPPPLFKHQLECLRIAAWNSRFCMFPEPGTGKTRIGLELYKDKPLKTLVICPINLIRSAWIEDAERFYPDLKIRGLWAIGKKKRLEKIESDWQYGIINFESFKLHVADFMRIGVQRVIVDESSKLKDPRSQISKAVFKMVWSEGVKECYLLSGCPAPNSEMEYYGQLRCIKKPGQSKDIPLTYWAWRNRYFYLANQYIHLWKIKEYMREDFENMLAGVSIFIKKKDCLDLPEQVFIKRPVKMDTDQKKLYKELENNWIIEHRGETTIAANALAEVMKLRQITAGFTIPVSGSPTFISNSKIKALTELLEEIGPHQVMIMCQFRFEMRNLIYILGQDICAALYGEVKVSERQQQIDDFKTGRKKYLIAHPQSAGHGLTFVNCSYMIWVSQDYSYEGYYQSCQRIHRAGQVNKCTYYSLLAEGTIDEIIYKAVTKKEKIATALLEKLKWKK